MSVIRVIALFWRLAACIVIAYYGDQRWSGFPTETPRAERLVGTCTVRVASSVEGRTIFNRLFGWYGCAAPQLQP